jgi:hypothetical protein
MNTYRIVPLREGFQIIETYPDGHTVIVVGFHTGADAQEWLDSHLQVRTPHSGQNTLEATPKRECLTHRLERMEALLQVTTDPNSREAIRAEITALKTWVEAWDVGANLPPNL